MIQEEITNTEISRFVSLQKLSGYSLIFYGHPNILTDVSFWVKFYGLSVNLRTVLTTAD